MNGSQELTEEEIDEFIRNEQMATAEGNNAAINSNYTPQLLMEFKDRHDAHHYFNFYAFLAGFEVVITHVARTTSKKRNNEIFKVTMKCNHQGKEEAAKSIEEEEAEIDKDIGKKPETKWNTNVQIKSNCPRVMVVKEEKGIWKIKRLDLEYNHELHWSKRSTIFWTQIHDRYGKGTHQDS